MAELHNNLDKASMPGSLQKSFCLAASLQRFNHAPYYSGFTFTIINAAILMRPMHEQTNSLFCADGKGDVTCMY